MYFLFFLFKKLWRFDSDWTDDQDGGQWWMTDRRTQQEKEGF